MLCEANAAPISQPSGTYKKLGEHWGLFYHSTPGIEEMSKTEICSASDFLQILCNVRGLPRPLKLCVHSSGLGERVGLILTASNGWWPSPAKIYRSLLTGQCTPHSSPLPTNACPFDIPGCFLPLHCVPCSSSAVPLLVFSYWRDGSLNSWWISQVNEGHMGSITGPEQEPCLCSKCDPSLSPQHRNSLLLLNGNDLTVV